MPATGAERLLLRHLQKEQNLMILYQESLPMRYGGALLRTPRAAKCDGCGEVVFGDFTKIPPPGWLSDGDKHACTICNSGTFPF